MSNQSTSNITCKNSESPTDEAMQYFVTVCLGIIIAVSITGNLLVFIAFKVNDNLRTVSNYFILSLAASDLITAVFVMPYDLDLILHRSVWKHGETFCQFYTTVYLVSTPASILNLLAVSIDRYRLIRDPFAYKRMTTPLRVLGVIACIWLYSMIMAFLPLMGWKDETILPASSAVNCTPVTNYTSSNLCNFDIHWDYSIMMSVLNFVIPPLIMTVIYFKIYQIARSHIRRIHRLESVTGATNGRASLTGMISVANSRRSSRAGSGLPIQLERNCNGTQTLLTVPQENYKIAHTNKNDTHANQKYAHERKNSTNAFTDIELAKIDSAQKSVDSVNVSRENRHASFDHIDETMVIARLNNNEKRKSRRYSTTGTSLLRKNVKAAKSLAIIVGAFFLCWYPHTIYSMIANACYRTKASCSLPPPYVGHLLLTLGFLNSMLNPFLYALHNKEFKTTYKRILRWN